jgi:hypothetical protein
MGGGFGAWLAIAAGGTEGLLRVDSSGSVAVPRTAGIGAISSVSAHPSDRLLSEIYQVRKNNDLPGV